MGVANSITLIPSFRRGFTAADNVEVDPSRCSWLWREVLKHSPDAFKVKAPGPSSQGKRSAN
jgi:hypothetical protein